MSKKIFFLMALPRSGNTLLASILNQNKDISVTSNSITFGIVDSIHSLKDTVLFKNFPDHNSLNNVLYSIYDVYYKDWKSKYIIDRGPAITPGNLNLLKNYFKKPIKCIVILRDLLDVLASYVKWFENEKDAFPNRYGKTIEEKLWWIMNLEGSVAKNLIGIENALKPEHKHMCHFLKYDELVNDTENQINKIYDFLEIPKFKHNLKYLNQFKVNGICYDDTVVGNRMHTIREDIRKEDNPYRSQLPKSIVDAYGHIKF